MAGIGFRLQKLLASGSFTDLIRAYFYSSIIATGPLLVVIISLAIIRATIQGSLETADSNLFQSLIIYIFAFSLIGVGPVMYIVTRYIADRYYLKQAYLFTPTFLFVLQVVFIFQTIVAILFLLRLDLPFGTKWLVYILYLFINGIWIAMLFLSASRDYLWIVFAFAFGAVFGCAAAIHMGRSHGLSGFLAGYTLGQGITFLTLTIRIFFEFGLSLSYDYGVLTYLKKYPYLVLVGVFYNLGIWIDKLIFWHSTLGETVAPGLKIYSNYDTPMFLAFITIVPSMAFFLIQMETSFVQHYHGYYQSIRERADLGTIRAKREAILDNLTEHFQRFVLFQGIISGLVIMFVYQIADAFHLNPYQMGVFRIGILGSFLQMGFLILLNILFYFDLQKDACYVCVIYFVLNTVLTLVTLRIGFSAYGFGYTGACLVAVVSAFLLLNRKLQALNYWTFMRQPILIPKFKFENEETVVLQEK